MPAVNTTAFPLRGVHVKGKVSDVWVQWSWEPTTVLLRAPSVCRTKETLTGGNFLSVINILMQLRKVRVQGRWVCI